MRSSAQWLKPWSWHTSDRIEKMIEVMDLSLFGGERRLSKKAMKTLSPKGVFLWFPNELKWLEPTKGLGHLI